MFNMQSSIYHLFHTWIEKNCACGKQDHYIFCEFYCNRFLYKRCFENKSCESTTHIPYPIVNQNDGREDSDRYEEYTNDDDKNPAQESDKNIDIEQNIEDVDNFDDLLTSLYDPGIEFDEDIR